MLLRLVSYKVIHQHWIRGTSVETTSLKRSFEIPLHAVITYFKTIFQIGCLICKSVGQSAIGKWPDWQIGRNIIIILQNPEYKPTRRKRTHPSFQGESLEQESLASMYTPPPPPTVCAAWICKHGGTCTLAMMQSKMYTAWLYTSIHDVMLDGIPPYMMSCLTVYLHTWCDARVYTPKLVYTF